MKNHMSSESQGRVGVDSYELSEKTHKSERQKVILCDAPMTMLFEVDFEPACIMVICLGGCAVIGHLALYARQGNSMVTLCLIKVISAILMFLLHVAGRRIIPHPWLKYA
jgi:hypothetical protein